MFVVTIDLGPDALEALRRSVHSQGGFQSLLRELQRQVSNDNQVVLTQEVIERIARYVHDYGQGGFQGRLDAILQELAALAQTLAPLAAGHS
jgi:hypothetical protein